MPQPDRAWIAPLARVGFGVKGTIYLLLGAVAMRVAAGYGGRLIGPEGVVENVIATPYGRGLTGALAAGLVFYAGWRFLEAFADANRRGNDARGLGARAVYALSGAVYAALAFDAASLALVRVDADVSSISLPRMITASPLSEWIAVLIAVALIGYGILQLRRAVSRRLSDQLSSAQVERGMGRAVLAVCRIGIGGRAIVLMLMGVVLMRRATRAGVAAATQTDSADSLRLIAVLPQGAILLAVVAAGLMGYGVFQIVQARYRRITPP